MPNANYKWTYEKALEEAKKYTTRHDFQKCSGGCYNSCIRFGLLESVCQHMDVLRNRNYIKEDVIKIANMCKCRSEFQKKYPNHYAHCLNKKILDEVCAHMVPIGNMERRCIYVYEFYNINNINWCYVGLTFSIHNRHKEHTIRGSVFEFANTHSVKIPTPIQKTEYVNMEDAIKLEELWLSKYIKSGWKPINKCKTGGVGGFVRNKSIVVFSLESGKYLYTYENIVTAAQVLNIKKYGIRCVLNKNHPLKSYKGYIFLTEDDYINQGNPLKIKPHKVPNHQKKIVMLSLNNDFEMLFDNCVDANLFLNVKRDSRNISAICNHTKYNKTYKGHKWMFKDEYDKIK
jgi:hypothetical protein